ncbi:unnamed protein product [Menidia menidia]|uniref:(Atlantic silverside) hypothetical protein n=1 Tax=Menidia menidia TaxID=238744 RepID=A0A8S4BJ44_9TELE|nr:unnamed protein product [Menidia menidia]
MSRYSGCIRGDCSRGPPLCAVTRGHAQSNNNNKKNARAFQENLLRRARRLASPARPAWTQTGRACWSRALSFMTLFLLQPPQSISRRSGELNMATVPVYCICRLPYDVTQFMIECDACKDWFHGSPKVNPAFPPSGADARPVVSPPAVSSQRIVGKSRPEFELSPVTAFRPGRRQQQLWLTIARVRSSSREEKMTLFKLVRPVGLYFGRRLIAALSRCQRADVLPAGTHHFPPAVHVL